MIETLLRLRPASAFLLLNGCAVCGGIIYVLLIPPAVYAFFLVVLLVFPPYYLWPAVIATGLAKRPGGPGSVKASRIWTAGICAPVLGALPVPLLIGIGVEVGTLAASPLLSVLVLLAFFCVLYAFWKTARALVEAEENKRVPFNRIVGTFFQFYFLPIGVFFLQRRVQAVLSPET
ncbi:MAG: hypothetical protein OXQ29_00990 [Rhodospirillaceae bacterium]|nr:hypothetical protein [Rhodospirillaceae bacterium]